MTGTAVAVYGPALVLRAAETDDRIFLTVFKQRDGEELCIGQLMVTPDEARQLRGLVAMWGRFKWSMSYAIRWEGWEPAGWTMPELPTGLPFKLLALLGFRA